MKTLRWKLIKGKSVRETWRRKPSDGSESNLMREAQQRKLNDDNFQRKTKRGKLYEKNLLNETQRWKLIQGNFAKEIQ